MQNSNRALQFVVLWMIIVRNCCRNRTFFRSVLVIVWRWTSVLYSVSCVCLCCHLSPHFFSVVSPPCWHCAGCNYSDLSPCLLPLPARTTSLLMASTAPVPVQTCAWARGCTGELTGWGSWRSATAASRRCTTPTKTMWGVSATASPPAGSHLPKNWGSPSISGCSGHPSWCEGLSSSVTLNVVLYRICGRHTKIPGLVAWEGPSVRLYFVIYLAGKQPSPIFQNI